MFLRIIGVIVFLVCVGLAQAQEGIGELPANSENDLLLAKFERKPTIWDAFVQSLSPPDRQITFLPKPDSIVMDMFLGLAGHALVFNFAHLLLTTTIGDVNNSDREFLQNYGLLLSDLSTDSIASSHWRESLFRGGIDMSCWLARRNRVSDWAVLVGRYLLVNSVLLYDAAMDIRASTQDNIDGVTTIHCVNGQICNAVRIKYHAPPNKTPWLSLSFPGPPEASKPLLRIFNDKSDLEIALITLRSKALQENINLINIYPGVDENGLPELRVQVRRNGIADRIHQLPGHFGEGTKAIWWTSLIAQKHTQPSYHLLNPLHVDIVRGLTTLLSGQPTEPLHVQSSLVKTEHSLLALSAGDVGGVIVDRHVSQDYELPDIYLDLTDKVDGIFLQKLKLLDQQRFYTPLRGWHKLAYRIATFAMYRAGFALAFYNLWWNHII